MTTRKEWLTAKIASEGYCCLNGYLRVCAARGESVVEMAANIEQSPHTLWYHYRKLREGKLPCLKHGDCMQPLLDEWAKENPPKRVPDET